MSRTRKSQESFLNGVTGTSASGCATVGDYETAAATLVEFGPSP
jgi:hypothetical protein